MRRLKARVTRRRSLVLDKHVFNCLLNWQRLSDDRSEAGSLFQSRGPATSNDLSPRRVLDHGMTHVMGQSCEDGVGILHVWYGTVGFNVPLDTVLGHFGDDLPSQSDHHHHIRFWYLRCCSCPGLRGRQHLATPHTRSP